MEKSFTNECGDGIIKWRAESNNVTFSAAARFLIERMWVKSKLRLVSALPQVLVVDWQISSRFNIVT